MPNQAKWGISLLVGLGLIYIGWKLPFVLTTVHVLLCFMLIIVVLLQSGKAADLAGAFGGAGSQTAFGPRGAATFLSQATTWCAIMFMLTSMALVLRQDKTLAGFGSVLQDKVAKPVPAPQTPPSPAPQTQLPITPSPGPGTPPASGQTAPAQSAPAPPAQSAPATSQAPAKPTQPPKK
jgi:preprotein translocase subunit SecG